MTISAKAEYRAELTSFHCKECYVYKIPPASSIGHRAEFWDVDNWLQEVSLKIVTCDEDCTIRLFEIKTGALFAECTVPKDAPLTTAVEPVVDSSRYFALRIEDPISHRHAFIGIGFRERPQASDFNAALYEHTQYLRRKKEALEMRETYKSNVDQADGSAGSRQTDLRLKPGETITLKLAKPQLSSLSQGTALLPRLTGTAPSLPQFQSPASSSGQVPLLAPPPASSPAALALQQSAASGTQAAAREPSSHAASSSRAAGDESAQVAVDELPGLACRDGHRQSTQTQIKSSSEPATASTSRQLPDKEPAVKSDDWGDFVS